MNNELNSYRDRLFKVIMSSIKDADVGSSDEMRLKAKMFDDFTRIIAHLDDVNSYLEKTYYKKQPSSEDQQKQIMEDNLLELRF